MATCKIRKYHNLLLFLSYNTVLSCVLVCKTTLFLIFAGFASLSLSLSSILIVIIMVVKGQIPEILCMPQLLSYDVETLQFIGVFPANFFCFFFFLLLVLVYNAGFIDFFHGVPFINFSLGVQRVVLKWCWLWLWWWWCLHFSMSF